MIVALGHAAHPHPISQRLLTSLTIVASLLEEYLPLLPLDPHEALVPVHVPPLGVGVDDPILFPLTQTLVFSLLKHFTSVEAIEDCIKHNLRVVTIRVKFGTETLSVRNDSSVLRKSGKMQEDVRCEGQEGWFIIHTGWQQCFHSD